ncbi:hypothetical protein WJX74_009654 [Apatococcus lobatus]|uniref:phosphoethanolamine N-methyltransferase n=1 Tax=Apatococcus lobatus TaxID=904363 RepID=A0AAW1REC1_9CHLO
MAEGHITGVKVTGSKDRTSQKDYWKEHSKEATVEAMMLDSKAADIDKLERPEILRMLGSVKGRRVVELGAGIGRFTTPLAAEASSVLALDFMENLIEANRVINGATTNVTWAAGDATELKLDADSADVVFSNWLYMYLTDAEVEQLARNALSWLSEGGTIFFRESCFKQSGDKARKSNPTHYRNPRQYFAVYDGLEHTEPDGRQSHFELVSCRCVDTYVQLKGNQNQVCWKWKKVVTAGQRQQDFRLFLDQHQYTQRGIQRYERIFGSGFISTGGLQTTQEFIGRLGLKAGQHVLDVGCGIGGSCFLMAQQHDVYVHGVDLSVNMVLVALDRAAAIETGSKVSFEIADCLTMDFSPATYDVVYSRDTLLHIHNKTQVFKRLFQALKPGGRLFFTDYARSAATPSKGFAAYIQERQYDLHTVEAYGQLLREAGFVDVQAEDQTHLFGESLERELAAAEQDRAGFVSDLSQSDYDTIVGGWQEKLDRVRAGEQRWGLFMANKPS